MYGFLYIFARNGRVESRDGECKRRLRAADGDGRARGPRTYPWV